MKRLLAVGIIALLTSCGSANSPTKATATTPATPATIALHGTLVLSSAGDFSWDFLGGSDTETVCYGGDGGYSDIKPGASVVVTNETGTTIGVGVLDSATATIHGKGRNARAESCDFTFSVENVPVSAKFYGIEVSHRGVVQFTPSQIGEIHLTLGN